MPAAAPRLQSINGEIPSTLREYVLDRDTPRNFGRWFIERGVRGSFSVPTAISGISMEDVRNGHSRNALEADQLVVALLKVLRARGLLDGTLVLWGGEFGQTPAAQGDNGRDHNPHGYTMRQAGGGIRGGVTITEARTNMIPYMTLSRTGSMPMTSTPLHQPGIDHRKLTDRCAGRDFRLTDIHGEVVYDIPV
ncbi:MAG: DUF1501 domain-containing protein [Planctomycetaceae bacterium]